MRSMPTDFQASRATLGSVTRLARHYRAAHKTIRKWLDEAGLPPMPIPHYKPLPECFAAIAPTMCKTALASRYGASEKVINRWLCEAGVAAAHYRQPVMRLLKRGNAIPGPKRDTAHDLAADYLRRFMPVSRCTVKGRFSLKGDHFRVGNRIMTFREVVEKADRMRARYEMEAA